MFGFWAKQKNTSASRGYSSILVLALIPVTLILVGSLADMAIVSRRQVVINKNLVGYSALLDATIDYTIYAIKNRWCMTDNWVQDANCDIMSDRSLERMTLDVGAVNVLREIYANNNRFSSDKIDLKVLEGKIDLNTIGAGHPLNPVVLSLKDTGSAAVTQILITVKRVDSKLIPIRGRETHLEIVASLQGPVSIFRGLSKISARSRVVSHPRELNYFSLIVANNLYLNKTSYDNTAGDFYIPTSSVTTPGSGVTFLSPVFVNGNVVVPSAPGVKSPATFTQRVILGGKNASGSGGEVLTDTGAMSPKTPGGPDDQVYSLLQTYPGLRRGVDVDGSRDLGLDVLAGKDSSSIPPIGNYAQCNTFSKKRSDLIDTATSDLMVAEVGTATHSGAATGEDIYRYQLGLNQGNYFVNQDISPYLEDGSTNFKYMDKSGSSIMKVRATVGTSVNTFLMSRTSTARIRFTDPADSTKSGHLYITTSPVLDGNNDIKPEYVNFEVKAAYRKTVIPASIKIDIIAYDVGTFGGRDRRRLDNLTDNGVNTRKGVLNFAMNTTTGELTSSGTFGGKPVNGTYTAAGRAGTDALAPAGDVRTLIKLCNKDDLTETKTSSAFESINWKASFKDSTRFSWHFAPVAGSDGDYVNIPASSSLTIGNSTGSDGFKVVSINGYCIIPATTNFVAGFFVCDRFQINSRSNPLTIIGTIIAGKGFIDPGAIQAGITFKSIYHPQSTLDLRAQGVLRPFDDAASCPIVSPFPVWWPNLPEKETYTLRNCNAVSLRDKANPFTWTSVDPDCGLTAGSPYVRCKKHATRLLVREISRESDLQ